jgi:hypothetical protein
MTDAELGVPHIHIYIDIYVCVCVCVYTHTHTRPGMSVVSIVQNLNADSVRALCCLFIHAESKLCNAGGERGYDIYRAGEAFRKCRLAF